MSTRSQGFDKQQLKTHTDYQHKKESSINKILTDDNLGDISYNDNDEIVGEWENYQVRKRSLETLKPGTNARSIIQQYQQTDLPRHSTAVARDVASMATPKGTVQRSAKDSKAPVKGVGFGLWGVGCWWMCLWCWWRGSCGVR